MNKAFWIKILLDELGSALQDFGGAGTEHLQKHVEAVKTSTAQLSAAIVNGPPDASKQ